MISYTSPVSYNRHACSLVHVHHVHCIAIYNRHRIPLSLALKQRLKKSWLHCGRKHMHFARGCKTRTPY